MEEKGLGKRINMARKDRHVTAEKLSELCNINATYLRQIEGGTKTPSLPVFISICNALKISPDYLLQDNLASNEISEIHELEQLWKNASPSQQEVAAVMIQALLKHNMGKMNEYPCIHTLKWRAGHGNQQACIHFTPVR